MNNKQIVFTKINTAEFLDSEKREPSENEVCVETIISTVSCGTEKANITGDPNVAAQGISQVIFPRYSGYSSSGKVVAVGKNVSDLSVGDRVAMYWSVHSKYNTLNRDRVIKIDDDISFEEASLGFISAFAFLLFFPVCAAFAVRLDPFPIGQPRCPSALILSVCRAAGERELLP